MELINKLPPLTNKILRSSARGRLKQKRLIRHTRLGKGERSVVIVKVNFIILNSSYLFKMCFLWLSDDKVNYPRSSVDFTGEDIDYRWLFYIPFRILFTGFLLHSFFSRFNDGFRLLRNFSHKKQQIFSFSSRTL